MNIKYILIAIALLSACVKEPTGPEDSLIDFTGDKSAYVLCEGIWNYDNASLTIIDIETNLAVNYYFQKSNPGLRLGDLANDIVIHNNIAYIAVSTTKTIEAIELDSGKSLGRIIFEGKLQPRELAIINDSLGFVTDLYDYSVYGFNPKEMKLLPGKIPVGPAPEGIAHYENYLFVANSGYGDILKNEQGAGTISVIDINAHLELKKIPIADNVLELLVNEKHGKLYACYSKLASEDDDSLGGIMEINLNDFKITRHWRSNALSMTFSLSQDSLFFINEDGVASIELTNKEATIKQLINNTNKDQHWYSLAVSPHDNSIWIGNAKNYQVLGEVLVYDHYFNLLPVEIYQVGINPAKIIFH